MLHAAFGHTLEIVISKLCRYQWVIHDFYLYIKHICKVV